ILFGTPPQAISIIVNSTANLLLAVSELFMSPFWNSQWIILMELCLQTYGYDTITINNQIFEQLQFGLPKDINGTKNVVIPDYIAGQIDIAYYPLIPFSETNQQIQISVTKIYVGGLPLNIAGTVSLNREIPNIQFNDDTVSLILSLLPGGKYSNGTGTVNCPIYTSFDLSFEFKDQDNQKWRLPSYAIADNSVGTKICKSTITGGAIDTNSWVFGSAFITAMLILQQNTMDMKLTFI
ncbi:17049_t:CDS:2, partial [Gigaspora margarita]